MHEKIIVWILRKWEYVIYKQTLEKTKWDLFHYVVPLPAPPRLYFPNYTL